MVCHLAVAFALMIGVPCNWIDEHSGFGDPLSHCQDRRSRGPQVARQHGDSRPSGRGGCAPSTEPGSFNEIELVVGHHCTSLVMLGLG